MSRKKQIEEAAQKYLILCGPVFSTEYNFSHGAEWADANPLPKKELGWMGLDQDGNEASMDAPDVEEMDYKAWLLSELAKYHPAPSASDERESSELERMKYWMNQYLQAYAPDFFNEPEGFTPKLDMNSAALVRRTLLKILNPSEEGKNG